MTSAPDPDTRIGEWIRRELGSVPEPERAVQEAIRTASTLTQRQRRRSFRTWLADRRGDRAHGPMDGSPEVVLEATADGPGASPPAATPRAAQSLRIPLVLAAVATLVIVSGAIFIATPRSGQPIPVGSVPRAGALTLEGPTDVGRDIVVAGDGSGHFWTISDAVVSAVDGDRITVMPGTYEESVRITEKDVSISGQGPTDAVVVRPMRIGPLEPPDGYTSLADFAGNAVEAGPAQELPDDWRYVFYLEDTDARISGMSVVGSKVGSAIVVRGGAPVMEGLLIDPVGSQFDGRPTTPHEALSVYGGSEASLLGSTATGLVSIRDGSRPTLRDNTIRGTCLVVSGEGSDAQIIGNTIESSPESGQCPRFNIAINSGAAPFIDSNDIKGDRRTDGIRVLGPDTAPTIQGNNVIGADSGIWIGGEARGLIIRNNVTGARAGIKIVGASPTVEINGFFDNEVGASIDAESRPGFLNNEVCDNAINVVLAEGASLPLGSNPGICVDAPGAGPSE